MRRLPRLFFPRAIIVLAFFGLTACSVQAQAAAQIPPEWDKDLGLLVDKIAAAAKPAKTLSLDVRNISSLSATYVFSLQQTLATRLTSLGFTIREKPPSDAELLLTLSESTGGYVWVAEVHRGDSREAVMVSAARDVIKKASATEPSFTLQRKLIWRQDARILDFALTTDAAVDAILVLVVLEPDRIAFYDYQGEWKLARAIAIPHTRPAQRDVSGRIDMRAGTVQLPDAQCVGKLQQPATVTCNSGASAQDAAFMTRPIVIQGRTIESYAALAPACGVNSLKLLTGPGDWTEPDFIQAYGVKNQTDAVSEKIQLPGPVLALWRDDDGKFARVVSRNLQTGAYEASIVAVSCGD